jgi:hypothetical protein
MECENLDAEILTVEEEEESLLKEAQEGNYQAVDVEDENGRDENEDDEDGDEEGDEEEDEEDDVQGGQPQEEAQSSELTDSVSLTEAAGAEANANEVSEQQQTASITRENTVRKRKRRRSSIAMPIKRGKKKSADEPNAACRSAEDVARRRLDEISAAELAIIMSIEAPTGTGFQRRRNLIKLEHPRVREFPYWGDLRAYVLGQLVNICKKRDQGRNLYHSERSVLSIKSISYHPPQIR